MSKCGNFSPHLLLSSNFPFKLSLRRSLCTNRAAALLACRHCLASHWLSADIRIPAVSAVHLSFSLFPSLRLELQLTNPARPERRELRASARSDWRRSVRAPRRRREREVLENTHTPHHHHHHCYFPHLSLFPCLCLSLSHHDPAVRASRMDGTERCSLEQTSARAGAPGLSCAQQQQRRRRGGGGAGGVWGARGFQCAATRMRVSISMDLLRMHNY